MPSGFNSQYCRSFPGERRGAVSVLVLWLGTRAAPKLSAYPPGPVTPSLPPGFWHCPRRGCPHSSATWAETALRLPVEKLNLNNAALHKQVPEMGHCHDYKTHKLQASIPVYHTTPGPLNLMGRASQWQEKALSVGFKKKVER